MGALCAGKANNPAALDRPDVNNLKVAKPTKNVTFANPLTHVEPLVKVEVTTEASVEVKPAAPASGTDILGVEQIAVQLVETQKRKESSSSSSDEEDEQKKL